MSVTDPTNQTKAIHINFTHFPQNLIVSSLDNVLSFQATNYFNQETQVYLLDQRRDTYGQGLQVIKNIEKKAGTTDVFNLIKNMS